MEKSADCYYNKTLSNGSQRFFRSGNDARPFNTWNPNINDDNRGYQKTSWSRITELLI